ncbi:hypothetical protein M5362_24485 [Streptomyces sp. Je 1-79]|uniref:hypothetical protein n=1 Tax=Streptomyces sp. Je 1-79 TaxID=2943847 RepID=UPI0021A62115|nr:hypothetical protein [Streptomyces sp. Je 1-79]MCT4356290.1 hypothetical protein [Streptomyces sp. Je 1-79]
MTALLALAGQTFLTAVYLVWFFPVFSGGIGPDGTASGSRLPVLVSLAVGVVAVALGGWCLRGVTRALKGTATADRELLVAAAAQLITVVGSLAVDLTPLAATAALSLPPLLAGRFFERRYIRRGVQGA